jgi:hypothetical protein
MVLNRLLRAFSGADVLIQASRSPDRRIFADLFGRSSILFLHLPPGPEDGLVPNVTQDELLAQIKKSARDLSGREQFMPLCDTREGRKRLLLFTQQSFVQEFAHTYVREIKRIMPFEVLTVEGRVLVPVFRDTDSVVLNAGSKFEYEVSGRMWPSLGNFGLGHGPIVPEASRGRLTGSAGSRSRAALTRRE